MRITQVQRGIAGETGRRSFEWQWGEFSISTNPAKLDFGSVVRFLDEAPWSQELSREGIHRAFRNSLCFSLYQNQRHIGIARIITDFATYAYICDVFIDKEFRGRRLGSWLMVCILAHPELKALKRISLLTHDAQEFYHRFGFVHLEDSCRYMEFLSASRR